MNVHISKKAELFHKAVEDVWIAEYAWKVSPNNAVWHCTQAVEKTMKGYLRCFNKDYSYDHNLKTLLDATEELFALPKEVSDSILYLNRFESKLRYKNMSADPTKEDAKVAIARTKQIMREFSSNPTISNFMKEAEEVHAKILKANCEDDPQTANSKS